MARRITSLFQFMSKKLPAPEKEFFWHFLAVLVKTVFFIYLIQKPGPHPIPGFAGHYASDTETYLLPAERFVDAGHYQPDFRMPGYAFFYAPLYAMFPKAV